MQINELSVWLYLHIENVWVCVDLQTENVIAIIKKIKFHKPIN